MASADVWTAVNDEAHLLVKSSHVLEGSKYCGMDSVHDSPPYPPSSSTLSQTQGSMIWISSPPHQPAKADKRIPELVPSQYEVVWGNNRFIG